MINSCLKRFILCLSLSTNLHASEFLGEDKPQNTPSISNVNSIDGLDNKSIAADAPEDKIEAFKNFKPSYGLIGGEEAKEALEALKNHPNHREFIPTVTDLPESVDLKDQCSPIQNQWKLASCTAFAGCGLIEFLLKKEGQTDVKQSELFLYYNERLIEGTLGQNTGARVATTIQALHEYGSCPENLLLYTFWDRCHDNDKPSDECYAAAKKLVDLDGFKHAIVKQDLNVMKSLLASGQPFLIAIAVFKSFNTFETFWTGNISMPNLDPNSGDTYQDGHVIMVVGYNKQGFIIRNSWGTWWGQDGYGIIPFEYLLNPKLAGGIFTIFKMGLADSESVDTNPTNSKPSESKTRSSYCSIQ